jgi:hypothetical protein
MTGGQTKVVDCGAMPGAWPDCPAWGLWVEHQHVPVAGCRCRSPGLGCWGCMGSRPPGTTTGGQAGLRHRVSTRYRAAVVSTMAGTCMHTCLALCSRRPWLTPGVRTCIDHPHRLTHCPCCHTHFLNDAQPHTHTAGSVHSSTGPNAGATAMARWRRAAAAVTLPLQLMVRRTYGARGHQMLYCLLSTAWCPASSLSWPIFWGMTAWPHLVALVLWQIYEMGPWQQ